MRDLDPADRAVVAELLGEAAAEENGCAIAAAIADLRGALPQFRRDARRLLGEADGADD